jgi:alpha-L-fucosidase 2
MQKTIASWLLLLALLTSACTFNERTKVACVGDSITEGSGISPQSRYSYPVVLDSLLGDQYTVMNLGRSATTMLKNGNFPYWTAKEFSNVFAFEPNIIIIKLGTNDTKPYNWNAEKFIKSYQAMIDTFRTIPTNPKIYVCLPVPVFKTKWGISDSTITKGVIPAVKKIAKTNNLPIIDLYNTMIDKGAMFFDSIHPNAEGAAVMAGIVAKELQ